MTLPIIADVTPSVMELEEGKDYWWCTCGRSQSQPFCDGSHAGTEFTPQQFTVDRTKNYALCRCKRTENGPFCDGRHKGLEPDAPT